MKNHKNITWIKGEDYCRWKGMHYDEYSKLIGTGELTIDVPGLIVVGEVVYCDSPQVFLEFLQTLPDEDSLHGLIHEITQVRTFEQMRFDIDLDMLREFSSDLEAYYVWLQANPTTKWDTNEATVQ